ncbi:hypothetical protein BAL199_23919 [alpha proteobacterium BAL199]|nr:hypothetical protein BAL199_23919 [alpha proteobacterium BAL199]
MRAAAAGFLDGAGGGVPGPALLGGPDFGGDGSAGPAVPRGLGTGGTTAGSVAGL